MSRPGRPAGQGGTGRSADGRDGKRRDSRPRPVRPTAGARPVDRPRQAAFDVLRQVDEQGAYANLALPALLAEREITGRDAALATELCYGTLRTAGTLDAILAEGSHRPLERIDAKVRDALRLGAYQLLHTRIPAHAAVSTTVALVRATAGVGAAKFANAVLRQTATHDLPTWLNRIAPLPGGGKSDGKPDDGDNAAHGSGAGGAAHGSAAGDAARASGAGNADRDQVLGLRYAHPTWIVTAFRQALGGDPADDTELIAALEADNERPAVHLAARPGRITRSDLADRTGGTPGRWSPYAVYLQGGSPGDLPELKQRLASVQDEGSQLVALAFANAPVTPSGSTIPGGNPVGSEIPAGEGTEDPAGRGERWLDLCAGPGGKAALLGGLAAERGARLTAVEIAEHRAKLVAGATQGLPVTVVKADGRSAGERDELPAGGFDRVLVDAPCTGLGALRRRPEARWRRQESSLAELTALQAELLAAALRAVRVGGLVAYVTCSPHLEETRNVVADALAGRPGGTAPAGAGAGDGAPAGDGSADGEAGGPAAELVDAREALPAGLAGLDGTVAQLWPHRHGTDAMFLALLRRTR